MILGFYITIKMKVWGAYYTQVRIIIEILLYINHLFVEPFPFNSWNTS